MRHLDRCQLHDALLAARRTTLALLDDLDDRRWQVPCLASINPPLWELGHVGWFMERWCLRRRDDGSFGAPLLADADRWYDSSNVPHAMRWSLDLPSRADTLAYVADVLAQSLQQLARAGEDDAATYFFQLALYHEDMHAEAFAYMRQTLGYPAPAGWSEPAAVAAADDVAVAGGRFALGAPRGAGFVFDNEKWSHEVELAAFRIAPSPVTNGSFARFVASGGYRERAWWTDEGWAWRCAAGRDAPTYWRRSEAGWEQRCFDRWLPLPRQAPVRHVSAHEADAYCRWAGRRLPTEAEWECAAVAGHITPHGLWEWTASSFEPYPGFAPDPYADYSQPWFGSHRSLRGASSATAARLWHPRFRNFYLPERFDVFAGLRTCALP